MDLSNAGSEEAELQVAEFIVTSVNVTCAEAQETFTIAVHCESNSIVTSSRKSGMEEKTSSPSRRESPYGNEQNFVEIYRR